MKYQETMDYSFFLGKNHFVYDHKETNGVLHLFVKSKPHSCRCPKCGMESRQLHATYHRVLQDVPIRVKQTFLHTNVYKYDCLNPECDRKVFTESLPFAKMSQVRTDALNSLILGVSMYLSNEGASKVLSLMGIKISNDSIQRLYDRIEFVDDPDVEGIGVDDVAIRKGQTYATAIYDRNDHHLIALLDGRDGASLKEWLGDHTNVQLVARDRASAYASAIQEVLPECVQVADRFHLLQNLLKRLRDIFKEQIPSEIFLRGGKVLPVAPKKVWKEKTPDKKKLDALHYDNSPPMDPQGNEIPYNRKRSNPDSAQFKEQEETRKKNSD